jgi:uncharacterized protein (TIGR00369 family)
MGMRVDDVDHGRVSSPLTPAWTSPILSGTVHGGIAATILDSAMGCAVHTTLPVGVSCTTLELKVNYVRAARTNGQTTAATGTVIHSGRRIATAEGRVLDEHGMLIARTTAT